MNPYNLKLVIKSDYEHIVFAEVYAPLRVDTDSEAMTKEEIKKSAYAFMRKSKLDNIDINHNFEQSGCFVVESFIARPEDPDGFIEGSWVIGVKIDNEHVWDSILKGELNGFSFAAGSSRSVETTVQMDKVSNVVGKTESSLDGVLPQHIHEFDITFDDKGAIIPTETSKYFGHSHKIFKATATEISYEHAHRFDLRS